MNQNKQKIQLCYHRDKSHFKILLLLYFDQLDAALVSIRDFSFIKTILQTSNFLTVVTLFPHSAKVYEVLNYVQFSI